MTRNLLDTIDFHPRLGWLHCPIPSGPLPLGDILICRLPDGTVAALMSMRAWDGSAVVREFRECGGGGMVGPDYPDWRSALVALDGLYAAN